MKTLNNLIKIAGAPLVNKPATDIPARLGLHEDLRKQLLEMLKVKNGFYAFESALHIFPSSTMGAEIGLADWNDQGLWIGDYQGLADDAVFFAEDAFGGQFCIRGDGVYTFDPEVGEFEFLANDLYGWANEVMEDYELLTGYPLAHKWQVENGPLNAGMRLVPKIPFVLQGDFSVSNLVATSSLKGMKWRADIAVQIRDLDDGESVELKVID